MHRARAQVATRLRARHAEIEAATSARVRGISDPAEASDPQYLEGLKTALSASIDYGIEAVELGEERSPPVPPILISQVRLAARTGVSLDTVLRRYFGGFVLFGDFVLQEAEEVVRRADVSLYRLLQAQTAQFDHLVAAVSREYTAERDSWMRSAGRKRAERVERLLAGELTDTSILSYELEAWHVGLLVKSPDAIAALRELARRCGRELLAIDAAEQETWAWIGGRRRPDTERIREEIAALYPRSAAIALGEPGWSIAGWRLTHRQARAALRVALRSGGGTVGYVETALVSSLLRDDLLETSLRQLFLNPLTGERDGGATLRETLRAYFAADRNISSAASALAVNRRTVARRLLSVERLLGRPLTGCAPEVELALRLDQVERDSSGREPAHYSR